MVLKDLFVRTTAVAIVDDVDIQNHPKRVKHCDSSQDLVMRPKKTVFAGHSLTMAEVRPRLSCTFDTTLPASSGACNFQTQKASVIMRGGAMARCVCGAIPVVEGGRGARWKNGVPTSGPRLRIVPRSSLFPSKLHLLLSISSTVRATRTTTCWHYFKQKLPLVWAPTLPFHYQFPEVASKPSLWTNDLASTPQNIPSNLPTTIHT